MKEIIVTLLSISTIVGLLSYMIRQTIWVRYIQPLISRKPELSILFKNGQNVLRLKRVTPRSLDDAVSEAMMVERQNRPYEKYNVPSYDNPFPQLFEGSSSNKKIYNR